MWLEIGAGRRQHVRVHRADGRPRRRCIRRAPADEAHLPGRRGHRRRPRVARPDDGVPRRARRRRWCIARDGQEGLELIRALGPAAVVLDIRLPGLDGWEVLARVREDEATRAVPVIIVSILDEKSRGLTLGAADYLVKPVGREELVGALRRVGAVHSGSLAARNGRGSDPTRGRPDAGSSHPRGRGQPAQPQARPRRADRLRLRRGRGARPARRASTLAASCSPDLVLMDLQLPGIDGYEALRLLRAGSAARRRAGGRRHRLRHAGGPRAHRPRRASTATSPSPSACARCRRRSTTS